MQTIHIKINGKDWTGPVEDGETLVDMIRYRLGLTGTKRGCEVGECGACTVLIDGVPNASCMWLAALADGKSITTIEGLSNEDGTLSPIQQAFIDVSAVQCGFCTPGMILSAYALLKRNPHPTREEIKVALSGNMCRCATYEQVMEAVERASDLLAAAVVERE